MIERDINYEKLKSHLETILDKDIYSNKKVNSCPHCHNKKVIKYGNYKNGQRFLCKDCNRTFCKRTNTTLYRSRKAAIIWSKYIDLMLSKSTLKECANGLNISLGTAFFWRHKILHALVKAKEPTSLHELINMMKLFTKESYKGDRNAPCSERKKVWTIIATDTNESILSRPISIGQWDKHSFDKLIYSKVDNKSYLNTFFDRYLLVISQNHNKRKKKKNIEFNSTLLQVYIRDFRDSLIKFKGVSTKYLIHYLYFSTIFSINKKYTAISLLYRLSNINICIINKDFKSFKTIIN